MEGYVVPQLKFIRTFYKFQEILFDCDNQQKQSVITIVCFCQMSAYECRKNIFQNRKF